LRVAEVDRGEARILEQRDDFRLCVGVVAGDEDHRAGRRPRVDPS